MQWVIEKILLERHDEGFGFPSLDEAAKLQGHEVFIKKYIPFSETQEIIEADPSKAAVFYGCIEWNNKLERLGVMKKYCPGAYLNKEALRYSNYAWHFHDYMLNRNSFLLRYGQIKKHTYNFMEVDGFFIRPDAVTKPFPGHVVYSDEDINQLSTYDKVYDDELCVIAEKQDIIGEYRHVVCRNEVIAQSQYRRDGVLDIRIDVDLDCQALAKMVAREEDQVDTVYVVDTALTEDGPKIIEFNSFSCAGLYACDTMAIVKHVSEAAEAEFKGENL